MVAKNPGETLFGAWGVKNDGDQPGNAQLILAVAGLGVTGIDETTVAPDGVPVGMSTDLVVPVDAAPGDYDGVLALFDDGNSFIGSPLSFTLNVPEPQTGPAELFGHGELAIDAVVPAGNAILARWNVGNEASGPGNAFMTLDIGPLGISVQGSTRAVPGFAALFGNPPVLLSVVHTIPAGTVPGFYTGAIGLKDADTDAFFDGLVFNVQIT